MIKINLIFFMEPFFGIFPINVDKLLNPQTFEHKARSDMDITRVCRPRFIYILCQKRVITQGRRFMPPFESEQIPPAWQLQLHQSSIVDFFC